mgnify:CR=1 FL=1
MKTKMKITILIIYLMGIFHIGTSQNQLKVEESKSYSFTFSIIGAYAGYLRYSIEIELIEREIQMKQYIPDRVNSNFTEFNENGEIVNYGKADQLIEKKVIQKSHWIDIQQVLSKADSLKKLVSPEFNAQTYCEGHGGCTNPGYWVHLGLPQESYYLFDSQALEILEDVMRIYDLGENKNQKTKRKKYR